MTQKSGAVHHLHEHKTRRASRSNTEASKGILSRGNRLIGKLRTNVKIEKKSLPLLGATIAGGAGLAIATVVGAAELAVGAAAAYVAFRVLRSGSPQKKLKASKLGQGKTAESSA